MARTEWFPIEGNYFWNGGPTERLVWFIDHFLQPSMKELGSFLKDTKHTLQLIEQINEKIDRGEITLDGVSFVRFYVVKMYQNITKELGNDAAKNYWNSRHPNQSVVGPENVDPFVTTQSLLEGLDMCIENNYFSFNEKIYKQVGRCWHWGEISTTICMSGNGTI